jgi:hypothetical protein
MFKNQSSFFKGLVIISGNWRKFSWLDLALVDEQKIKGISLWCVTRECVRAIVIRHLHERLADYKRIIGGEICHGVKVFRKIITPKDECALLDEIGMWSQINKMTLNLKKYALMHFGARGTTYIMNRSTRTLEVVESQRDLGVMFDPRSTFSSHCAAIVASTTKMLGMLRTDESSLFSIKLA